MKSHINKRRKYGQTLGKHLRPCQTLYRVVWPSNKEKILERHAYQRNLQFLTKNQNFCQEFPTDKVTGCSEILFWNLDHPYENQELQLLKSDPPTSYQIKSESQEEKKECNRTMRSSY